MAPKKKKKPAANPARGFATTSLPSKSKVIAEPDDASVADDRQSRAAGGTAPVHVGEDPGTTDGKQPTDGVQIQDMTPEELEAHLENSELESMLDKYCPKVLADARRQVARLETERRQLRLQTQKLSTYNWLSAEVIHELFEMASEDEHGTSAAGRVKLHEIDEEKLVVDLWTLERVLRSLNFPKVPEAMVYIAELALSNRVTSLIDSVPGLAEALQWYAGNTQSDELTNYEQTSTTKTERSGGSTPAQALSEPTTATQSRQSPASTPAKVSEAEDDSLASSDSEDEDDPSKLTDRYIRIQSRIWAAQNQISKDRQDKEPIKERRLMRLNQKLQQIRRDPLFDEWEAEDQWSTNLLELQTVQKQRMRAAAATNRRKKKQALSEETVGSDPEATETTFGERQMNDDEDALLGAMFGESEDAPCAAQNQTASESPVKILDFPRWTGLSPRRLLEELCKSHDSKSRVRFRALVQTSYSARHELEISWAVDIVLDPYTVAALPCEISAQTTERNWSLVMKDVAAANIAQSESYISTLALFLLSTIGAGEARAIGRLPTVWRDLFKDLADGKQALVNEEHKKTLRRLRELVHEMQDKLKQHQGPPSDARTQIQGVSTERRQPRPPTATKMSPEQVSREWSSRTSRLSFQQMLEVRQQLPVHQYKDRILSCIEGNPVSVICAETGAGKSSGIPVLILEQEFSTSRDCRILVTQPRRISAVTLARRVSQELGESRNDIGSIRSLVGYAIRLESKTSNSTRITYATTGVLLRMLEESPDLDDLDYLILDEVHERTMDLDLLFIALRKLQKRRTGLKIILMSATVDAKKFSDYFDGAPVLDLPGRTFPVDVKFLEDAIEATNDLGGVNDKALVLQDERPDFDESYANEKGRPIIIEPAKYSSQTQRTVASIDEYRIDYNLIAKLAACIATRPQFVKYSAALLIFMPGIGEMRRLHNLLLAMDTFSRNWVVHLLHSTFSTEELERAFERPPPGHRKIVIATNIAETGITIPDVTAVIDTCKEKIMRFDERRQLSRLTEGFISRSSARQRRGRAARVQDGLCFHLVTKHRHDNQMLEQQVPEMLRLSLQDPMLRIKVWDLGSIEETLNAAIDPPFRKNILRAIEKLKDAGALTKNEALTHLGQQIARLPLEVSLAKLAIFGVVFKCLDPVLTMISLLTSKSPFLPTSASSGGGQQPNARLSFSRGDSDLLSSLNAYESWKKARLARTAQDFCRKNHISDQTMGQVEEQKIQLLVYLVDARLVVLDPEEKGHLNRARSYHGHGLSSYSIPTRYNQPVSDRALNAISAMALYPRILMREGKGWRNVYTNQIVTVTSLSINHPSHSVKPPRWLSFYEAMQNTRSGNLNVFETSAVPESALAILLGSDAEFKFYAGVMVLDGGKVKLSVRQWSELMAIKILRDRVEKVLQQCYSAPGQEVAEQDRKWLDLWLRIEAAQEP
ncbi:putative helicase [Cladophialophora carrionii]|uniref:RNA helicase n=1 Tax=Cladophialophora carrionii TaxID=86049 RepID=A0A1C1D2I5_9EURO|nr:putative helicase [Cladophialophora carrionii]